jgi:hydroxylysine kinase
VDTLTSPSTLIPATEAVRLAAEHYGLECTAAALPGERDSNFRLEADGVRFFLKVAHAAETEGAMNFETEALLHVEREAPHLDAQRVVRTRDGRAETSFEITGGGERRRARLTTFLDGDVLSSLPMSDPLAGHVGRISAELGQALASFEHPVAHRKMLWDVGTVDLIRPLLDELAGMRDQPLLEACLVHFEERVKPSLRGLRAQVLHNDVNRNNTVLLGPSTIGLIDFGDMVHTQVVSDLAVSVTDFLEDAPEPWPHSLALLRSFNRVRRLQEDELDLLFALVRTRLAQMLIITEWRMKRFPENRAYIARKTERSWSLLGRLAATAESEATARLHAACDPS